MSTISLCLFFLSFYFLWFLYFQMEYPGCSIFRIFILLIYFIFQIGNLRCRQECLHVFFNDFTYDFFQRKCSLHSKTIHFRGRSLKTWPLIWKCPIYCPLVNGTWDSGGRLAEEFETWVILDEMRTHSFLGFSAIKVFLDLFLHFLNQRCLLFIIYVQSGHISQLLWRKCFLVQQ